MQSRDKTNPTGTPIDRSVTRLTEPLIPVSDSLVRRRMQILALFMLVAILCLILTLALAPVIGGKFPSVFYYFGGGFLIVLMVLQYLSRTRWQPAIALLLVLSISVFPFVVLITGKSTQAVGIETVLIWLIFGFLSSSFLLPRRWAILSMGCVLAGILMLPIFISSLTYRDVLPAAGFLSAITVLVVASLIYRDRVNADLQGETLSEKEFAAEALNGLPGIFLICDAEGQLKRYNERLEQVTEFSAEELQGLRLPDLVSEKDRPMIENMLARPHPEGVTEAEVSVQTKTGLLFQYYFTMFGYESSDRRFFAGYGTDITDFKRLEEARRAVVEHSRQGLAIYQQGRIVFANPAYSQILGYSLEELYAMDPAQATNLIYFEDSPSLNEQMQSALAGAATAPRIEIRVVRKDGTLRWIEFSFSPINYRNRDAIQATAADIADRKTMETEQARLIRELETKNAELERFTYTVSHDLKSPLITIRGFLGFLERDSMANNKARIAADVQRITEATDKMQRLLNDVLSLSRIGRVVNPPENVAFGTIAAEAVERVAGQIRQRSVYVRIADGLPMVRVDRERVVEVVQNLLDNAVKFMGDQWNPTIQIGVHGTDHNGYPILFVEDNGMGIDPVFHDQVFGLFNKLDPSSEGTGIGLAIVKRIIETHGGRIWVESEGKGKGARFLFTLPPVTAII